MSSQAEIFKKLTKLEGLLVLVGGWIIIGLLPIALIYNLVTLTGSSRLKALAAMVVLLIAGVIAIKVGRRMMRTGYDTLMQDPKRRASSRIYDKK